MKVIFNFKNVFSHVVLRYELVAIFCYCRYCNKIFDLNSKVIPNLFNKKKNISFEKSIESTYVLVGSMDVSVDCKIPTVFRPSKIRRQADTRLKKFLITRWLKLTILTVQEISLGKIESNWTTDQ